ncbi:hypothetical protein [Spiroplasma endosymbiont of Aleiodes alternator]|uniref:hypothetical protein n=1 Tax=Spiroplasma endosymbiont of Aleiodes alternator TaxID=3139329 RepID=UPI003CCB4F0F
MNTFLKVFLTQRLQFCVYFILDVHINTIFFLGTKFSKFFYVKIIKILLLYK